jgi:DNA-binding transcriptional MerR regulator
MSSNRQMSIGEFAAATQLTPKALRLYDEQGLMRPASTDSVSGYRYYRNDQVATGRLIRALRGMGLSLAQIAEVVALDRRHGELMLRELSKELDERYAEQKRAYHSVLLMMRTTSSIDSPQIDAKRREAHTVSVWSFSCDRSSFVERYFAERDGAIERLDRHGMRASEHTVCALLDPLTDEEGRVELRVPVVLSAGAQRHEIVLREIPAQQYASIKPSNSAHAVEFTSAVDALFDWFDRGGYHAVNCPLVSLVRHDEGIDTRVEWAFESAKA